MSEFENEEEPFKEEFLHIDESDHAPILKKRNVKEEESAVDIDAVHIVEHVEMMEIDEEYQSDGAEIFNEDDILMQYDVFVSQQLADSLLLLQYPTRTTRLTDTKTRVKILSKQIQHDVILDTDGPNYSKENGERCITNNTYNKYNIYSN